MRLPTKATIAMTTRPIKIGVMNLKGEDLTGGAATGWGGW